jgi:membrane protease YdiL (CAAX protease family)
MRLMSLLETMKMNVEDENTGEQKTRPWGFWPTVGFSLIIFIVYTVIQVIIFIIFAVLAALRTQNFNIEQYVKGLESNGLFLAIATCAAAPFTIGMTILFAKIRKQIALKEYLGLQRVGWKELLKWSLILLIFSGCFDTLTYLLGRSVVPEFMLAAYKNAYSTPLLWFALVIAAPLTEEIFFRGFVFKGIEHSRLGPAGAVIISALAWSAIHLQYDAYGLAGIFAGGLLLGYARFKSKSIYPSIIMHTFQNIIATVEVIICLRMMPSAV